MKFYVDFNRVNDRNDDVFEKLGCTIEEHNDMNEWCLELNTIGDLEELQAKLNDLMASKGKFTNQSLVIDFDPPTIYFDDAI